MKLFFSDSFKEILINLILIFKNPKMLISFLVLLPFIYYIIKIQIIIGFIFFIWYFIIFLIFYNFLKTNYEINCREISINFSHIFRYTILNTFLFVPKAKAYIIFYNILYIIWNKKEKFNFLNTIFIFIIFFIIYLIKLSIVLLIGYTFLSLFITSNFIIKLFKLLSRNFENKKAMFQHILINCCLNSVDSVGKAEEMNIIIKNKNIIFNMIDIFKNFFEKIKNPELFWKAYYKKFYNIEIGYYNKHFTFIINSKKYNDKNLSKNLTSSEKINVKNINNENIKYICKDSYKPNLKGEEKINFLTPTYELDMESSQIGVIKDINTELKMQTFMNNVQASILNNKCEKIIYSKNDIFIEKQNVPTIEEYANEYKLDITDCINNLTKFEKINEECLNTPEGVVTYTLIKQWMKNTQTNTNKIKDELINRYSN